jgi:site-specific DNA-methyltransferase (adenine-specific)
MKNFLLHDDARRALLRVQAVGLKPDLVYLDPPYNVGIDFSAGIKSDGPRSRRKPNAEQVAYSDRWGGIDAFLSFLESTLVAIHGCMSNRALLWLHMDQRAIHDAKVLCDRIFGRGAFRGEVVWSPGNGARGKHGPAMTHQTLIVYSRDASPKAEYTWNCDAPELREPYASTSLEMHFRAVDEQGRRYRERKIGAKTYRYYADNGRKLGSIWTDIPAMVANTPIHAETTGYPTQKPERLLERILRLSSKPGDLVCDPMCGSGTTLAVAAKLSRSFIGIDQSPVAIEIAHRRLQGCEIELASELPNALES